jgi:polysaccharide pyruvyl transferase WcaK-like protein
MKIEVKGVEFSNKGAELMLHSIIQLLDRELGQYQLVLSPGHLLPYEKRARLGAWQKFSFNLLGCNWTWLGNVFPAPITRLLGHFGIVVEKDINMVLDASGFVYSDKWDDSRMLDTLKQLKRMAKYNQRYVFLPQAFGPFLRKKNRACMSEIIKLADCVISRDQQSFEALKGLTVAGSSTADSNATNLNVMQYPDITPLMDVFDVVPQVDLPERFVCIIPNHKMLGSRDDAQYNENCERYFQFLLAAVANVEDSGLTPVILNHEGAKDEKICRTLIERLNRLLQGKRPEAKKPLMISGISALEVKKVIGLSVFCVSSRFHGCVSGLSQGVPVIGTSWSHKYEELYRYYLCSDHVVDIADIEVLKAKMTHVIVHRDDLSRQLLQQAQLHKQTTREMWQQVLGYFK